MNDIRFHIDTDTPRVLALLEQQEMVLPALWLRERCQDPEHIDPDTQQRLFDPHHLPEDLSLTAAERLDSGRVRLGFSDGSRGEYDLGRLAEEFRPRDGVPAARPWDASLDRSEVTFDWRALTGDSALHKALGAFLGRGFLLLQHVPTDPETILEVATRFGYVRDTNFGRHFEVYSRPGSNDLAYAAVALGPHTDNPYREPPPGIQLLHCLANETSGGLSTLTDSLAAGQALADEDPEAFGLLATTPVRFRFVDAGEELIERRCIIRRDAMGEMVGVYYSPRLDGLPLMAEADVRAFHRARQRLATLLSDARYEMRFPLRPGELLMFDNSRVLHGRTKFDAAEGRRHLQGCYIDLDEPRSRYRTLSRRLQAAATGVET